MTNMQRWARVAGVLLFLSIVAGFIGEMYVPMKIIAMKDPEATARNILENESLFRTGFAAYLIEALCDTALSLVFFVLLRPVNRDLSLLAAFFGLLATATFATAEMFYFAALPTLNATGLAAAERSALALLSLRMYAIGSGIFMAFYGISQVIRGWLIVRSLYLPKTLGVLLMIAGGGFIVKNFTQLLAPAYSSQFLLAPMFLAMLALFVWLVVKGVDLAAVPAE